MATKAEKKMSPLTERQVEAIINHLLNHPDNVKPAIPRPDDETIKQYAYDLMNLPKASNLPGPVLAQILQDEELFEDLTIWRALQIVNNAFAVENNRELIRGRYDIAQEVWLYSIGKNIEEIKAHFNIQ